MTKEMTKASKAKFRKIYARIIGKPLVTNEEENEREKHRRPPKVYFQEKTKDELYDMAKELDIDGRSYMNKGELVEAVRENHTT